MNKIIDICLCVLAILVWLMSDILNLLSVIIDSLGFVFDFLSDVFRKGSRYLEHFIAFLINKNRKRNLK